MTTATAIVSVVATTPAVLSSESPTPTTQQSEIDQLSQEFGNLPADILITCPFKSCTI